MEAPWPSLALASEWLRLNSRAVVGIRSLSLGPRTTAQLNIVLPGSYAWFTTVAWPSVAGDAPVTAKAASGLALLLLISGAWLAAVEHRLAASVGIAAFFGACVATWVLAGPRLSGAAMDPLEATLGGIGWVLFVLGWGSGHQPPPIAGQPRGGEPARELRPRGRLARGAGAILGSAVAAACGLLFLGWSVGPGAHALLARTVVLLGSVGLVVAAAQIAVDRGRTRAVGPVRGRLQGALRNLTILTLLLILGVLWQILGNK